MNIFRANLSATFRDVAEADSQIILEQASAIERIKRMKLEAGHTNKKARPAECFLFVMLANDVANVLAQKAFDAFAEFLDAVDVDLGNIPIGALLRLERWNFFIHGVIPGNVRDEIFNAREGLHGHDRDGLIHRQRVHACFAG